MKAFSVAAIAIVAGACGGSSDPSRADRGALQFVMDARPVVLTTGESVVIQLLVIGQHASEAAISSADLPPFATLDGSRLTLAPTRAFQGDYSMTLVAESGSSNASATLHVSVQRDNTPPFLMLGGFSWADANGGPYDSSGPCTPELHGTAAVHAFLGDAEGDSVTWEAEVVPKGQPFSGKPTQSVSAAVGIVADCSAAHDPYHSCKGGRYFYRDFELPLEGLAIGTTYSVAIRLRDQLGAVATSMPAMSVTDIGNGWWTGGCGLEFTLVP